MALQSGAKPVNTHRALIISCILPDTIHLHFYGQEIVALLDVYCNFQSCKYLKNKEVSHKLGVIP